MTGIGTFWRTVRHLKAEQLIGRVKFRLTRPQIDLRPAPPLRAASGAWVAPAPRAPSLIGPTRFMFLNLEHDLSDVGWDSPAVEKLWRYNQHYFDDLNAIGAPARAAAHRLLVARWIAENAPGLGTGWEPFPVSLRIVNWIKWFAAGVQPEPLWVHSLALQARWLRQRLEWHLLGNHLFANAKALFFAGLYFDGDEAREWLDRGLAILEQEIPEQILADGGQFERSPMYHALALEDVLDLLNVVSARADAASRAHRIEPLLRKCAAQMLHWLRCMSHPDGRIAFFNDAADGIAPSNNELERYATALGITAATPPSEGVTPLMPSGYVRMSRGAAVALLDVAPIGPDYMPGHAHADTLSFELSVGRRRVVVNGGTSRYGLGAERLRERGTAAHSTVQIGSHDSSEVWGSFRVGRRARPTGVSVAGWDVEGGHDGWRFLPGSPQHRRHWRLGTHELWVEDTVTPAPVDAVARYHLAPGLQLHSMDGGVWRVLEGDRELVRVQVQSGVAGPAPSQYAPRFGIVVPTQALAVSLQGGRAVTRWTWNPDAHPLSH
jgi:hypothetical protein